MQSKTLISLGALAAIGLLTYLTLRAPEKGQRVGPPPRPIAAFKATDVESIEITSQNGKDHVILVRDGASWKMTAPSAHKADASLVKTAVDQLEKISFGDLVTENKAKFADLEVSDDKGAHVVAMPKGNSKPLFDAWIGKASSGFTMLRPTGKDEVWQASGLFKYTYAREAKMWRDHTIFEFGKDDVTKLTVTGDGQKLVLERVPPAEKGKDASWKVLESSTKVEPLDASAANNLVQAMSTLRASEFDDSAKPADVELADAKAARLAVTATVKGQEKTLLFGKVKGDEGLVQVQGEPQIYLLQKYLLERLAGAPRNFRDKTLTKVKADDLAEIAITVGSESITLKHEGAAWKSSKGELDDAKAKPVVSAFENLAGSAFADKGVAFGKQTGQVVLKLKDKSQITLKVGATVGDSDYVVQKVGSPDLVLVKKYQIDRFLKKPSDLTKTTTAAK